MTRLQKFIRMIPFFILCGVMVNTWFQFISGIYISSWYHITALVLVIINAVVYGIRYKTGLLMTGIVLLLGITNGVCFFSGMERSSIGIGGLESPPIQETALLLLLIYCFFNFGLLYNWYLDSKEEKRKRVRKDPGA